MVKKDKPNSKENVGSAPVVSGRSQAEEALRHSEEQFRLIVENIRDMIFTLNLKGEFIFVSTAVKESLGYDPAELQGLSFQSIVHPDDMPACQESIRKNIEKGERMPGFEYRVKDKTGNWHRHVTSGSAVRDSQGSFLHFLGIAKDITNSKRVEDALRDSEAQKHAILNGISTNIALVDKELKILWANKASGDSVKKQPDDMVGQPCYAFWGDTIKPCATCPTARAFQTGRSEHKIVQTPDGRIWEEGGEPVFDAAGNVIAVVEIAQDITERKKTEEALRESEERFRYVLENMQDAIWSADLSGQFEYLSPLMAHIYGRPLEEMVNNPVFWIEAAYPADQDSVRASGETLIRDGHIELEYRIVLPDGKVRWILDRKTLIRDSQGELSRIAGIISDVTDRKQAEEALRANEVKLDNALRSVQMGVWSLEIIGNKRIFDDQTCHLLGLNPAEFGGSAEEFFSAIHPDDREKIRASLVQTIEKEVLYEPGYRVIWPDGSVHHICARGRLVLDDHGHPLRISGIIWDITESKLAEEALRSKQIMLERTEGIAHIGSWEWDAVTDAVTWSDELYRIFQRDPREGAPSFAEQPALYHPDDFALLRQAVEVAVADGTPYALELRAIRKDGKTRVCMARGVAEKALSGRVVRLVGSIQDITQRKMAELSLKESEEKYRMVVENAHEAIVIAVDGVNKFANRKITELTGYTREEITARPFIEFVHSDDRQMVATRYQQRLKGEDIPDTYSFRIVDKLGYIKWVELSAASITWEGKTGTLNFVIDITDRKRLEEERQRVGKLESVGVLAGGIAHDFNNILTSILGNVSMAKMEVEPGSETYKSLEQAEKASQRARDLTKQLLTFSKGGSPVTKLASLTELLRDTAGFALRGSNVKCNFSIPADLWHAEIDTGQVSQVIQNLVINAQQAMPTGGTIEICAENISLSSTQSLGRGLPLAAGNYIRIAVTDHGSGIASEHLDKVFDPFFTTKQTGSGLGLATSFSIARQHNGHLSVESEVGAGSIFSLYLPASMEIASVEKAEKQKIKPAGQARILVMDDEQGIKEVAGRMLNMIGYKNIEFAADGAEVIKLYEEAMQAGKPISLVILDLTIPGGMGGREAIQKLLTIDPGVKAIVSSGYHEDVVMAKYKEHGFSGMVVKPYTVEQLAKALEDALG